MPDNRLIILEKALPLVPFEGWSEHTLKQAAKEAGIDELTLQRTFPGGVKQLVVFFLLTEDAKLEQAFANGELDNLRMGERIETIILQRLQDWLMLREVIRKTISKQSLSCTAPQSIYRTVDLMWKLAGDKSSDFSFYTKRATLFTLYSAVVLYWLNDESEDLQDSKIFLKNRLGDIASFGKFKKNLLSKFF